MSTTMSVPQALHSSRTEFPQFPPASKSPLGGDVIFSPTSAQAQSALVDLKGLPLNEVTLIENHVSNTGAVICLSRVDYSEGVRAYRVFRECHAGNSADTPPLLRLVSANDLLLFALGLTSFFLALSASHLLPLWLTASQHATSNRYHLHRNVYVAVAALCISLVFYRVLRAWSRIHSEEILAIRGVGLQVTTYDVFNQPTSVKFVDLKMIRNIVIHDAFHRYQPIMFLSSSIENEAQRLVYFRNFLPRLDVLQPVLRGVRHILYGEEEVGPTLAEIEAEKHFDPTRDEDSGADDSALMNTSEVDSSAANSEKDH